MMLLSNDYTVRVTSSSSVRCFAINTATMLESSGLVFNLITVNNYDSLFNFIPVDRALDSMMAPTSKYSV